MYSRMTCVGRLTQDVELRYTTGDVAVATVRLAVERDYKNRESQERETDFFNVVLWRSLAESAARHLSKGRLILVEGRLKNNPWKDKNGAVHRDELLEADRWYFLDAKRREDEVGVSDMDAELPSAEDLADCLSAAAEDEA